MPISKEILLGLVIPERLPSSGDSMLQPRDFEAWIKRLPMVSGTRIVKQLFKAIQRINRTGIPPQHRIRIAELFTQPIADAIAAQERKFVDAAFPLSEKARLTSQVCARLNQELAIAYKIAVHDVAMKKIGAEELQVLIFALLRAVRHLAETVYRSVLVYDPVPQHVWRELHSLFVFAGSNKWATTRVKFPGDGEMESTTVRELYLQILLFAAASPYRIRQPEIRALYRSLRSWTSKVKLAVAADLSTADTCFIVQLKKDQPALHISLVQKSLEKPALEFNTAPLIRTLQELYEEIPPDPGGVQPRVQKEELSRDTLRNLIRIWGNAPPIRPQRTHLNFELNIVVGLSRIYSLISSGVQQDEDAPASVGMFQEDDQNSAFSSFAPSLLDDDSGPELIPMERTDCVFVHDSTSSEMLGKQGRKSPPPIWPQENSLQTEPATTASVYTLNESAGGYCVNWHGRDNPGIKIGELVGIQALDSPADYGLAVARWMRNEPSQGLKLGLQLIAPHVFAVTVTTAKRRRDTPIQCLLVPELKSAHRPASLVAPVLCFKVGLDLHIRQGETEQKMRLVRLLESTGAFAQYQVE